MTIITPSIDLLGKVDAILIINNVIINRDVIRIAKNLFDDINQSNTDNMHNTIMNCVQTIIFIEEIAITKPIALISKKGENESHNINRAIRLLSELVGLATLVFGGEYGFWRSGMLEISRNLGSPNERN